MKLPIITKGLIVACLLSLLAACTNPIIPDGPPPFPVDVSKIPNAKPRKLPRSHYGNPKFYTIHGKRYTVLKSAKGYHARGIASWYGTKFNGRLTSSHEPYNMLAMTAASPILPIPSFIRVTNLKNKRSVIVKVNDRGPFAAHRILDLSYVAAKKLGYANRGTAWVEVQTLFPNVIHHKKIKPPLRIAKNKYHFYLQLGVFHQLAKANHLKKMLKTMTPHPIVVYHTQLKNRLVYRLRVGPLLSINESNQLHRKLAKRGVKQSIAFIG